MALFRPSFALIACLIVFTTFGETKGAQYLGKYLGKLSELHHGVSGEVYAVDARTLHIKDFTYDGQGPAAYFFANTGKTADRTGFRLRDEKGSPDVIRRYRGEGVTLTLPEGKSLNNIRIFYVWCEEFEVNFGDVKIPRNFDYPRPQKIEGLKGVHDVASDSIVLVDAQTLLIPNFSYDGQAPDAKFWVGVGPKPSPQGIRVPDENGKELPLRRYDRKTIVLTLPGDLTVFDIGHFGIWCEAFTVDFGHVKIPQQANIPPSLRMLGVSPQSKLNCEVLYDDLAFEVRWAVAGESIVLQLVAKLDNGEYMSFGLSGDQTKSVMIGGDVVVAWVDKQTLKGYAEDYFLNDKSQCSGPTGSCPDNRLSSNTNNIRLLNAAMVNGYSIVTYQRPLRASDLYDKPILTNQTQAIIWAVGPLNQRNEVSFHSHYTRGDALLDFGRAAKWNCPMPEGEQPPMRAEPELATPTPARTRNTERRRGSTRPTTRPESDDSEKTPSRTRTRVATRGNSRSTTTTTTARPAPTPAPVQSRNAWTIPPIECYEPEDGVFYAQMGPTGGKRGYPAITGHVGWGISWYINGLLIPEINVVRGTTYTFVVEGGFDPEIPAKYHPFYITDDPVGGYEYKTPEEKKAVQIFAGTRTLKDGTVVPTGTGRLCHWTEQGGEDADDFESFGAYQRTLELKCDRGEPGLIQWTPDKNTPDTVYYQCFTHRYLGWKINVLDSCDQSGAGSEVKPVVVEAPSTSDLEPSSSVRLEQRVKANQIEMGGEDKPTTVRSTNTNHKPSESTVEDTPPKLNEPIKPNEHILFHHPTQSYFNPYYGPFFAQHHLNPYVFENPFESSSTTPRSHAQDSAFRPSPPLNSSSSLLADEVFDDSSSSTTILPSSSSTTTSTSTTTAAPSTTMRGITDKYLGAAAESSKLILSPMHGKLGPPPHKLMSMRRPMLPPPNRMKSPAHYHRVRVTPYRNYPPPPMFKKPIWTKPRPYMKLDHYIKRPSIPHPIVYASPPQTTRPIINQKPPPTSQPQQIKNVEISDLQPATEREPELLQTAPSIIKPVITSSPIVRMRPAYNTGFKPETVVIESGFKPIMSKELQDRMFEAESQEEPDYVGIITLDHPQEPQPFEPIFIPSPTDKPTKRPYMHHALKFVIKHPRSLPDYQTAAAERVDSYYLPPQDTPISLKNHAPVQPSNIDFDRQASPPDVVVSYDGRRVSGASLTAKLAERSSVYEPRASKAAELIKARPQFVPFKGELPPLGPEFLTGHAPRNAYLSRDLGAPAISTKLQRVRSKRNPHHTPEHTAEQNQNSNSTKPVSAANPSTPFSTLIVFALITTKLIYVNYVMAF